ncbi:MAG: glycosyltransferase, partial [Patescibacteria group bacterium]
IITGTNTTHICYMLTPTRYLWSGYDEYFKKPILRFFSKPIISYLRWWDKVAATRPDKIIAISTEVQKRIKKYYNRDSEIIFPPVDLPVYSSLFTVHKDYYLYVGRLVKYKKVDLLIDTFNELGLPLVIVGTGPEAYSLKHKACDNIKFLGQISDGELSEIYSKAKAFLMPQDEDFGITAVEAQSFGVPVIAYNKGGSLDTVVDGKTGILFNDQTKQSLINAIARFDRTSLNGGYLITNAKKFSKDIFKNKLSKLINNL